MQVKSIEECAKSEHASILLPPLSYHFPLRPWFCLLLSVRLRQVLLYITYGKTLIFGGNFDLVKIANIKDHEIQFRIQLHNMNELTLIRSMLTSVSI